MVRSAAMPRVSNHEADMVTTAPASLRRLRHHLQLLVQDDA